MQIRAIPRCALLAALLTLALGAAPAHAYDLAVTLSDAPDPVTVGGELTYTMHVVNNGPDPSLDADVDITLPGGVTYLSASAGCTPEGNSITCGVAPLAAGASTSRTVVVRADAAGEIAARSTVATMTTDSNPANDAVTATTQVNSALPKTPPSSDPLPPAPPAPTAPMTPAGKTPPRPAQPKPKRLAVEFIARWDVAASGTRVETLTVREVPRGASVEVRCTGSGCTFERETRRTLTSEVKLGTLFRRRLQPGAEIEVRVSEPGAMGSSVRYLVRRTAEPLDAAACPPRRPLEAYVDQLRPTMRQWWQALEVWNGRPLLLQPTAARWNDADGARRLLRQWWQMLEARRGFHFLVEPTAARMANSRELEELLDQWMRAITSWRGFHFLERHPASRPDVIKTLATYDAELRPVLRQWWGALEAQHGYRFLAEPTPAATADHAAIVRLLGQWWSSLEQRTARHLLVAPTPERTGTTLAMVDLTEQWRNALEKQAARHILVDPPQARVEFTGCP